MSEFEGRANVLWNQLQEFLEPRDIRLEVRRQLKQERSELLAKSSGDFHENPKRPPHRIQTPDMSDLLRRLECERESGRDFVHPRFEDGGFWDSPKRPVDFD